jgi:hypothetical protein
MTPSPIAIQITEGLMTAELAVDCRSLRDPASTENRFTVVEEMSLGIWNSGPIVGPTETGTRSQHSLPHVEMDVVDRRLLVSSEAIEKTPSEFAHILGCDF